MPDKPTIEEEKEAVLEQINVLMIRMGDRTEIDKEWLIGVLRHTREKLLYHAKDIDRQDYEEACIGCLQILLIRDDETYRRVVIMAVLTMLRWHMAHLFTTIYPGRPAILSFDASPSR